MSDRPTLGKVAFVGDYVPRQCGIATFTADLCRSFAARYPRTECFVVPVNDRPAGYSYPPEVRFEIAEREIASYQRAADFINFASTDVVCLQHEYGIYGGPAGSHVLALLRALRPPVVTTLHTVLREPGEAQHRALAEVARLSRYVAVMTERGRGFLRDVYGVDESKILVVPHGIPDMPFVDPNFFKDRFGVEGKQVLLTFGLLSPNKGIEHMLRALPAVLRAHPETVYIVLGATHPNLVRDKGEEYRIGLQRLAVDLGVEKHVIFHNRFVDIEELKEFLGAADLYVTPYLNPAQITSGTLAYAFGCGKAVVSTPYWHAEELLADGRGVLVPFADADALGTEVSGLLTDATRRHAMRKKAYLLGRDMVWRHVAGRYAAAFRRARRSGAPLAAGLVRTLEENAPELPPFRFHHLLALTDSTGLLQHARFGIPNYEDGYCTDDNARALILHALLEGLGASEPGLDLASSRYAAFLNHAFDEQTGLFRNFMGYDRCWVGEEASDDSQGRALWALGTCVGRCDRSRQAWAAQLFDRSLGLIDGLLSPRAWAFVLVGVHEYFRCLSGDRRVNAVRTQLTDRLLARFRDASKPGWDWFEDVVTYDNAKLPHALILSGHWCGRPEALETGLRALRWLLDLQTSEQGVFRPVGSNGFHPRGGPRALYDQQPIEAQSTVSACLEAYLTTGDETWYRAARRVFEWFLGRNDLGQPLYDPKTGGCSDALQVDRLNANRGAESTLAFLLALAEMRAVDEQVRAFRKPPAAGARGGEAVA